MRDRLLAALLVLGAFRAVPCEEPVCDRVVAVGDLHGGFEAFLGILRETAVVDESGAWSDPRACLIQVGDVADRGGQPRMIYEFLMELQREAPGRVEMLLGNHEVMNVVGDLRYTERAEFEAFAAEETAEERAAGFEAFLRSGASAGDLEADRREFDVRYPAGWFAHRRAFSPEGRYGAWLLERPAIRLVDGTLYVHGGIGKEVAREGVEGTNARVAEEVREYVRLRRRLVAAGVVGELEPFRESFWSVRSRLREAELAAEERPAPAWVEDARRFLALDDGLPFSRSGPLWDRSLADDDLSALLEMLPPLLSRLGAERVVVGHTTQEDGRIRVRAGGRVFLIDTGAGPAFEGRASALEVSWTGRVEAVYRASRELLEPCSLPDEEVERFLRDGTVASSSEIGVGVTRPKRVLLDLGGRTLAAAFKTVNIHETKPIRMERSGMTFELTDRYANERAAYLLDRMLGIGMVAPAVIRTLDGVEGALVAWVSDAICERDRAGPGLSPEEILSRSRQRDVMEVFDALIANVDRNLGNRLTSPLDGKLHLIDHSRSFRLDRKPSKAFLDSPSSLPRALLDRLEALDRDSLLARLDGLVTRQQVKALLARRDAIVSKVESDRRLLGDAMVFHEMAPRVEEAPPPGETP